MSLPILPLKQNTPEWHEWRAQGLGASDIPALYGKHPTMSEYQLWLLKTGQREAKEIYAKALEYGHVEEEKCLEYLRQSRGEVHSACIQHSKYHHIRASIDAYFPFLNLIMQIKSPFGLDNKCITIYQHIPEYWIYQMQGEEAIARSHGISIQNHLCLWLGEGKKTRIFTLESDLALQADMIEKANHWWMRHVVMGNPVPPDTIYLSQEGIKNKLSMYEEYQHTIKELESKKRALKCEIEACLDGTSNYHTETHQIIRTAPRMSYDFNAMKLDGIDLSKYRVQNGTVGSYTIKSIKKKENA
jgi:putative phage-type endonuclease